MYVNLGGYCNDRLIVKALLHHTEVTIGVCLYWYFSTASILELYTVKSTERKYSSRIGIIVSIG